MGMAIDHPDRVPTQYQDDQVQPCPTADMVVIDMIDSLVLFIRFDEMSLTIPG